MHPLTLTGLKSTNFGSPNFNWPNCLVCYFIIWFKWTSTKCGFFYYFIWLKSANAVTYIYLTNRFKKLWIFRLRDSQSCGSIQWTFYVTEWKEKQTNYLRLCMFMHVWYVCIFEHPHSHVKDPLCIIIYVFVLRFIVFAVKLRA